MKSGLSVSTFRLASYFETRSTKCGKHWNGDALIVYDKSTFEQESVFWTQCDVDDTAPDSMRKTVVSRMEELLG